MASLPFHCTIHSFQTRQRAYRRRFTVPNPYLASSLPEHQLAELHRLMNEEVKEVAVFFMDPEGIITVWNRGAEEMKGFTAQDAIGSHLSMLYIEEDKARNWPQHNLDQ